MTFAHRAAFVFILVASTRVAFAQDAETFVKEGVELRKVGKDEEALAKFTAAWELSHSPKARAQMALAEQALGRWGLADQHMREALAATTDPWIVAHQQALEEASSIIAKHIGTLQVLGGVAGAEVLVNGSSAAKLPMNEPIHVEAGTYTVEVRLAGYYPVSKTVVVTAGALARETIEMKSMSTGEPLTSSTASTATPVAIAAPAPTNEPPRRDVADGGTQRTLGYMMIGLAGVSLGAGVFGLVKRNNETAAYNDDKSCPGTAASFQPIGCSDRIDSVHRWETVSLVGFIGAGVFTATSLVLILSAPSAPSTPQSTTAAALLACGGGPGTLGLACRLTY
jgi:hypothetical protein